jgi:hypothetical protein
MQTCHARRLAATSACHQGAAIETIDINGSDPAFTVVLGDQTLRVDGALRTAATAELRAPVGALRSQIRD